MGGRGHSGIFAFQLANPLPHQRLGHLRHDLVGDLAHDVVGELLDHRAGDLVDVPGREPGAPARLLCLGFAPAIPWIRTLRVVRRFRGKRTRRGRWSNGFGALVLGEIAWSLGEFLGYLRGEGDACSRLW